MTIQVNSNGYVDIRHIQSGMYFCHRKDETPFLFMKDDGYYCIIFNDGSFTVNLSIEDDFFWKALDVIRATKIKDGDEITLTVENI